MTHTKKVIYTLILALVVVSGLVFANREIKNEITKKTNPKPLSAAERKAALKNWEASPDGIQYKKWEASAAGKKVHAGAAKIRKSVKDYSNMEGVVTSLSLPKGSRLGSGVMVRINGEDYILAFRPKKTIENILNFENEIEHLYLLKENDKIIIRGRSISYAPKYAYPIVTGDYVERDGKPIYKGVPRKGGC